MWNAIRYTSEHLFEMLEMAREYYGQENDIANKEFILHQYFENPAGDALIDLAWDPDNKKLAGQYVVWPMRFAVNGKEVMCVNSLNTLTREAYRGQGIFTGLAEKTYERAAAEGMTFCYGIPNPNSYPGFLKKLSFIDMGRVPLYLRPLQPSAMVREFMHSMPLSVISRPFDSFFAVRPVKKQKGLEITRVTEENIELADQLWLKLKGKYPIMNIRDSKFFRFRYLRMPKRTYFPYFLLLNGQPVALAVGRMMEVAGMQCGMLADFLFAPGCGTQAKVLLRFMLRLLQNQGASLAGSLMLSHTEEASILRRNGFFRCPQKLEPQPFPLILRVFDKTLERENIQCLDQWFFCMGDYDVI